MDCSVIILILNFICVCLALAGNVASLTGYSWWKVSSVLGTQTEHGLWRICGKDIHGDSECKINEDIFSFDENNLPMLITILLLIISCGFVFIALITTLSMFCCLRSKCCWYFGVVANAVTMFLGGGAGLAALVYAEIELETRFSQNDRGWSNIVGWVGSGLGLVGFILSSAMCCVKHEPTPGGNVVVNPPYAGGPRQADGVNKGGYPMVNRGYSHGY